MNFFSLVAGKIIAESSSGSSSSSNTTAPQIKCKGIVMPFYPIDVSSITIINNNNISASGSIKIKE
jgi:hypothetical protein